MTSILMLVALVAVAGVAFAVGYMSRKQWAKNRRDTIEAQIESLMAEGKNKQKEIILQGQDKALQVIEDAKKEAKQYRQEIDDAKRRLEQRETMFDQKILELENRKQELTDRMEEVAKAKEQIATIKDEQLAKLEKVAALTREEAEKILMDHVERMVADNLHQRMQKLENQASDELEHKAHEMLATVIERCSASHSQETTSSIIDLPSDDMKGRIIGKEGRNIRAIEQLTGVEVLIDDTPQAITLSSFSPIRRQVAKRALEKLMADGRIHPARIEESIKEAKQDIAIEIKKAGEEALYDLGLAGFDPKLVQIIGRLKYRTSYGQNILNHSVEVAHLATIMAQELGANVAVTKKAALLHDIGKAVDHDVQGTHIDIGRDICKKFGISEDIIVAAMEHHDDKPTTLEGVIVKAADAISGSRPGARKDTYENYIHRLEELEGVAKSFEGIDRVYAIQAGREVRVFVSPDSLDDAAASRLARNIAEKVEAELKYPGEIKVTVIREKRVIEFAR